jgi:hypothetical protein
LYDELLITDEDIIDANNAINIANDVSNSNFDANNLQPLQEISNLNIYHSKKFNEYDDNEFKYDDNNDNVRIQSLRLPDLYDAVLRREGDSNIKDATMTITQSNSQFNRHSYSNINSDINSNINSIISCNNNSDINNDIISDINHDINQVNGSEMMLMAKKRVIEKIKPKDKLVILEELTNEFKLRLNKG